MKHFFLLLVLVNLGLLAWHFWIVDSNQMPEAIPADTLVPALSLADPNVVFDEEPEAGEAEDTASPVTELAAAEPPDPESAEPEPESDEQTSQPEEENPAATLAALNVSDTSPPEPAARAVPEAEALLQCMTLGPFSSLSDASAAAAQLGQKGLETSQRLADGQVWVGYWVHLPPYETREEAEAAIGSLKKQGISDFYILPGGEARNAVSLGVFSEQKRAERRAAKISALGYQPEITRRYRDGQVYWVDFDIVDPQQINPVEYQATPDIARRLVLLTCSGNG